MRPRCVVLLALNIASIVLLFPSVSSAAQIIGTVTYNGLPASNVTSAAASVFVRNEVTGQAVPGITMVYSTTTAEFTVSGLPVGTFSIQTAIPAAVPNGFFPGNYYGYTVPIVLQTEGDIIKRDRPVDRLIHLVAPIDNSSRQRIPPPFDVHPEGKIVFTWDPIKEALYYKAYIDEYQFEPSRYVGRVFYDSTKEISFVLPLSRNLEGYYYQFRLYAYNSDGVQVGQFMIVYYNGCGWDYRFVVGSSPQSINQTIVNLADTVFTDNASQLRNAISNKLDEIQALTDQDFYQQALDKLVNDIRTKIDGCFGGNPKNDWITDCGAQSQLLPLVDDLIAYLKSMI